MAFHPDVKEAAHNYFKLLHNNLTREKISVDDIRSVNKGKEFVYDLVYFGFQPEIAEICPSIKELLFEQKLLSAAEFQSTPWPMFS